MRQGGRILGRMDGGQLFDQALPKKSPIARARDWVLRNARMDQSLYASCRLTSCEAKNARQGPPGRLIPLDCTGFCFTAALLPLTLTAVRLEGMPPAWCRLARRVLDESRCGSLLGRRSDVIVLRASWMAYMWRSTTAVAAFFLLAACAEDKEQLKAQ